MSVSLFFRHQKKKRKSITKLRNNQKGTNMNNQGIKVIVIEFTLLGNIFGNLQTKYTE